MWTLIIVLSVCALLLAGVAVGCYFDNQGHDEEESNEKKNPLDRVAERREINAADASSHV